MKKRWEHFGFNAHWLSPRVLNPFYSVLNSGSPPDSEQRLLRPLPAKARSFCFAFPDNRYNKRAGGSNAIRCAIYVSRYHFQSAVNFIGVPNGQSTFIAMYVVRQQWLSPRCMGISLRAPLLPFERKAEPNRVVIKDRFGFGCMISPSRY